MELFRPARCLYQRRPELLLGDLFISGELMFDDEKGRQKFFRETALPHLNAVYDSALRLAGNEADAEDLTQTTFLKAYRFIEKFHEGTDCKAWLLTILKNTFINQYRKRIRGPVTIELDEEKFPGTKDQPRLTTTIESDSGESELMGMLDEEVEDALGNIGEESRKIVLLSDVDGFSYKEIAEIMGCPVGTVRSRLSRARRALRALLRKYAMQHGMLRK